MLPSGKAPASQAGIRGFESRHPLQERAGHSSSCCDLFSGLSFKKCVRPGYSMLVFWAMFRIARPHGMAAAPICDRIPTHAESPWGYPSPCACGRPGACGTSRLHSPLEALSCRPFGFAARYGLQGRPVGGIARTWASYPARSSPEFALRAHILPRNSGPGGIRPPRATPRRNMASKNGLRSPPGCRRGRSMESHR